MTRLTPQLTNTSWFLLVLLRFILSFFLSSPVPWGTLQTLLWPCPSTRLLTSFITLCEKKKKEKIVYRQTDTQITDTLPWIPLPWIRVQYSSCVVYVLYLCISRNRCSNHHGRCYTALPHSQYHRNTLQSRPSHWTPERERGREGGREGGRGERERERRREIGSGMKQAKRLKATWQVPCPLHGRSRPPGQSENKCTESSEWYT